MPVKHYNDYKINNIITCKHNYTLYYTQYSKWYKHNIHARVSLGYVTPTLLIEGVFGVRNDADTCDYIKLLLFFKL